MKLLPLSEALRKLEPVRIPLNTEEVNLLQSLGRILAEDVTSSIDLPPFDKSSRDGYAVKAKDTFTASELNPVKLRLKGLVKVGEVPKFLVSDGECAYVPTGAPIPEGCDSVVMIEDTLREDEYVYVYKPIPPRSNVVRSGFDIPRGSKVLERGTMLGVKEISLLASIGCDKVKVYNIKASVISTGPELVAVGLPLGEGKIYDVNSYMISAYLEKIGLHSEILGIADDSVKDLQHNIAQALKKSDIVFVSGGTSKGESDVLYQTLSEMLNQEEGEILFHGLALKPGKPTLTAIINGKPVFGLPGNPTSAFTVLEVLIKPWLFNVILKVPLKELKLKAKLTRKLVSFEGKREIVYVALLTSNSELLAHPILKGSESVTTFAEADGYIEIPEDVNFIEEGEVVEVKLLNI
ncbi:MAG: molybdopterin-binding protein [Candidatus Nezhaarchaeota archaeon]|nr:molybdopterin-binding protein [Candidatus Nezhaarchaeota archaeon]MCX8141845.1 molybdopterin-binding protein [Candidatus Nezhaarchaeota archaeon]MDW8050374.1 molybdopterin-binding protein [Nitrososphaerota archaeon]